MGYSLNKLIEIQNKIEYKNNMVCITDAELARKLHGIDILPNNYRFQWIADAVQLIKEGLELGHEIDSGIIADNLTQIYNNEIINIIFDDLSRLNLVNQSVDDGIYILDTKTFHVIELFKTAIYLEINMLVVNILNEIEYK